ncbi:MAG: GGDEF domain-containing protein [Sphingomonadales bacterium 63-6]|nr:MAG: GGDEF domain-containing protein [Sphingomonadales bacterium 63-6]
MSDYEQGGSGWFWETDGQGAILYLSQPMAELFGKSPDMLAATPFLSLFVSEQTGDGASPRSLSLMFGGRKTFTGLTVRADIDGKDHYWQLSGRPKFDAEGNFQGYRGHGGDITESRRAENETERLAQFDSLTGLSNRPRMQRKMDAMLTAFRAAKRTCAVMLLDLDRFKQVNDTLGHKAGDELLKEVAQRIKRVFDTTCEIGRLGGDEFQVLIPDMDDRGQLGELATKVIAMLSQPFSLPEGRCTIGASVGIAIAPYDGVTREEVVHSADVALYAAKNGGRGQFRFFSRELQNDSHLRRELERDLREALERGQLSLEYQPIVAIGTNRIVAMEALLRWYHPERGKISPEIFIPIAEDSNLIVSIGEWVLRKACADAAPWPDDVRVCVNISEQQIITQGLSRMVANALSMAGLPADRLECELKESAHFGEGDVSERELKALRRMGVRLALDDFGTGASSLGYLKRAPFETIKIDPSFLRGAFDEGSRNGELIGAIVALADALGIETVAEGVEAMEEFRLVQQHGVKNVQGFVYSRPMALEEVEELLAGHEWEMTPTGPEKQRSERRKLYRRIHIIHEDHYYDVVLRDLSRTGAMIEGLLDVPVGTEFVVDFGEGQLAVAKVVRSHQDQQGLTFETPLVNDGAGGLCTRNRVSPYLLAAGGLPLAQLPPGHFPLAEKADNPMMLSVPRFGTKNLKAKLEY